MLLSPWWTLGAVSRRGFWSACSTRFLPPRREAPGCQPRRRRRCLHHRFPARRRGHGGDVNTILIVTADDALRGRLVSALGDHSVFVAQSDPEALKTLRLIDIDVILRGGGMPRGLETFVASVK